MESKNSFELFLSLAKRALSITSIRGLVERSSYEEMISFQQVHNRLIALDVSKKTKSLLADRHPFVKVSGRWCVSMVKLYLYLIAARPAMLKTKNDKMYDLYNAVQNMQNYIDEAKKLDETLKPHNHEDYEQYQEMQTKLYETAMLEQRSLFEKM